MTGVEVRRRLSAATLAALLLTACGQKPGAPPPASGTAPVATDVGSDAGDASRVGTVSKPVTGFTYTLPQLGAGDAAVMEYLRQEQDKVKASYAEFFTGTEMDDIDTSKYQFSTEWTLHSRVPGLMVLSANWMMYTGGAHENFGSKALLWDERAQQPLRFADLFEDPEVAKELLGFVYCSALDAERLKRRGEPTPRDDTFGGCPDLFEETESYPSLLRDGSYRGITINLDPYVAGPFAEGPYSIEIPLPSEIIPLIKEPYRPMFGA